MDNEQYRNAVDRLGLSNREAAERLGLKRRTVERWRYSDTPIQEPAAILLTVIETIGLEAYDAIMKRHRRRYR
jgi:DNA-binding transcriptional regulator YiaG